MIRSNRTLVYLDNSATTRPSQDAVSAMLHSMTEAYYNPSSLYGQAMLAEKAMESCRHQITGQLGGKGRVIFTSGGTEANNLAILGSLKARKSPGEVLYSAGEHPAVVEACESPDAFRTLARKAPLDSRGLVDLEALESLIGPNTRVICLMHINNETGAIQPIEAVARLKQVKCPDALFHVDGVQAFMRHPVNAAAVGIDSYTLSGHKIHAPKGIGALWLNRETRISPLQVGGGQEGGLRSGTENTPGIAGLAAAIEHFPPAHQMRTLKLRLFSGLQEAISQVEVNGPEPSSEQAADHILNVSFPPVRAEIMLHALEAEGILVGNGSACAARKNKGSHVLKAMGLSRLRVDSAIRFSLNPWLSQSDIDRTVEACVKAYALLKDYVRR